MAANVHKTWSGLQSLRAKKHSGGPAVQQPLGQNQNCQHVSLPPVLFSQKLTEHNCKLTLNNENGKLSNNHQMTTQINNGFYPKTFSGNGSDIALPKIQRLEGSSLQTHDGSLMSKREKESQSSETAATSVSVASVSPVISAAARPENYVANTVEQFGTDMISAISETDLGNKPASIIMNKQAENAETKDVKEQKYTTGHDQEAHMDLSFLENYNKTSSIIKFDDEGHYTQEFRNQLLSIRQSYFQLKNPDVSITTARRRRAGQLLADSGSVQVLCDVVGEGLQWRRYAAEDSTIISEWWNPLNNAFTTVFNFMDCCPEVSFVARDQEQFVSVLLQKLKEWYQPHVEGTLIKVEIQSLLPWSLGSIHNMAMYPENVSKLQKLHASEVLLPYLNSTSDRFKLSAVAAIADIATEAEADQLATSPDLVQFLLKRLKNAFVSNIRRHDGWSVSEIVKTIRQLARNDANKRLLVKEGALPLLTQGLKSAYQNEQEISYEAIWVLSFDKENISEIMKEKDLVDEVVTLYKEGANSKTCQKACRGILWQVRHELVKDENHACIAKIYARSSCRKHQQLTVIWQHLDMTPVGNTLDPQSHVMISYQWADQETVKQIRDHLRSHGIKVWMDIDDMGGSTLQAMAEAVEKAFVIVCCMSQKYKDSPNCRAEAEYAFQKHKRIIPLIMERSYKPDGWLGMILGAKLFYDFSGKYSFESRLEQLIKAVQKHVGNVTEEPESFKQLSPEMSADLESSSPLSLHRSLSKPAKDLYSNIINKINSWNRNDVQAWLKRHDLNGTELEFLTGKEIVFLHNLRQEAPEFFYNTLEKKLHIETLSGLISFTNALDDLSSF
ncbi:uncharacterized protein LOC112561555 [Pomacea canaliculata]|uniref:uncharacterized protein LOC112561555 n=1 Tax=Pomacea canaliculata TaxID=400727 RepID=UPI000D73D708|nr:uncharacterized protein LOC112561555 [Pomacea canaliculata]